MVKGCEKREPSKGLWKKKQDSRQSDRVAWHTTDSSMDGNGKNNRMMLIKNWVRIGSDLL